MFLVGRCKLGCNFRMLLSKIPGFANVGVGVIELYWKWRGFASCRNWVTAAAARAFLPRIEFPFARADWTRAMHEEVFFVGASCVLLSTHEGPDVVAVNFVLWKFTTAESGESGEKVDGGCDFSTSFSGRNMTGPSHDGWLTNAPIVDASFSRAKGQG